MTDHPQVREVLDMIGRPEVDQEQARRDREYLEWFLESRSLDDGYEPAWVGEVL